MKKLIIILLVLFPVLAIGQDTIPEEPANVKVMLTQDSTHFYVLERDISGEREVTVKKKFRNNNKRKAYLKQRRGILREQLVMEREIRDILNNTHKESLEESNRRIDALKKKIGQLTEKIKLL